MFSNDWLIDEGDDFPKSYRRRAKLYRLASKLHLTRWVKYPKAPFVASSGESFPSPEQVTWGEIQDTNFARVMSLGGVTRDPLRAYRERGQSPYPLRRIDFLEKQKLFNLPDDYMERRWSRPQ